MIDEWTRQALADQVEPWLRVGIEGDDFVLSMGGREFIARAPVFDAASADLAAQLHQWAEVWMDAFEQPTLNHTDFVLAQLVIGSNDSQLRRWLMGLDPDAEADPPRPTRHDLGSALIPDPEAPRQGRWRIVCADRSELIYDAWAATVKPWPTGDRSDLHLFDGKVLGYSHIEVGHPSPVWLVGRTALQHPPVVHIENLTAATTAGNVTALGGPHRIGDTADPWVDPDRIVELRADGAGIYLLMTEAQIWVLNLTDRYLISAVLDRDNPGSGTVEDPEHLETRGPVIPLLELIECRVGHRLVADIATPSTGTQRVHVRHPLLSITPLGSDL